MWFSIRVDWVLREKKNQFFVFPIIIDPYFLALHPYFVVVVHNTRIPQTFIAK
jgi:hypothetical protein